MEDKIKITRQELNGVRSYVCEKDGINYQGTSVTTFLDKFKDDSWKARWHNSLVKNVENADFYTQEDLQDTIQEKANVITKVATDHGTYQHELVEKYLLGKSDIDSIEQLELRQFLNMTKPIISPHFKHAHELPIFYADDLIQIGGTLDSLLNVNCNHLFDKETEFELANERRNFIIDWKFPQKPKYGDDNLGYMVQLAIYRLGLKFSYDLQFDDALIVMTPKFSNPKTGKLCKMIYLYYLDKRSLDYFSQQFFLMVEAYNEGSCWLFDWNGFKADAKSGGYLAKRLYLK